MNRRPEHADWSLPAVSLRQPPAQGRARSRPSTVAVSRHHEAADDHHCDVTVVHSKETDVVNRLDDVTNAEVRTLRRQRFA